jgi:hypothetical protein
MAHAECKERVPDIAKAVLRNARLPIEFDACNCPPAGESGMPEPKQRSAFPARSSSDSRFVTEENGLFPGKISVCQMKFELGQGLAGCGMIRRGTMISVEQTRMRWFPSSEQDREEIRRALEVVLSSAHFCNSKRYPAFLRYVVEQSLAGQAEMLKERTIVLANLFDWAAGCGP